MPWHSLLAALIVHLLGQSCSASAGSQFIVYEAGASNWIQKGDVAIAPLTSFGCSPDTASLAPGSRADDIPQVFILSSPESAVRLEFNGSAIAVYGIFIAHNACEIDESQALAILDESAPPSPTLASASSTQASHSVGAAPSGCARFAEPRTVCGALLAHYTALDGANRQRISVSSQGGRTVAVINAVVGDAPAPKVSIISRHQAESQRVRVILPAVLVPVLVLSVSFGALFFWGRRWRRRQRADRKRAAADDGLRPFVSVPSEFTPASDSESARSSQLASREKLELMKGPLPAPAPPATAEHPEHSNIETLQRAIAGAGITTRELVVSLRRLQEQAGDGNATADNLAPPRYDG